MKTFIDLVYAGKDVEEIILNTYPEVIIEDASDFLHTERFSIEIPNVDEDVFYPFAIKEGFALDCLKFQCILQSGSFDKEEKYKIEKWIGASGIKQLN